MNSFLFLFFVPIIGTVQSSNSINYLSNVRPCVRRVEGKLAREYRAPPWRATGTEVPRARGKKCTPAADRRARTKRQEKIISAGAMARERRKKYYSGGSEKKFWRRREHNPQIGYVSRINLTNSWTSQVKKSYVQACC